MIQTIGPWWPRTEAESRTTEVCPDTMFPIVFRLNGAVAVVELEGIVPHQRISTGTARCRRHGFKTRPAQFHALHYILQQLPTDPREVYGIHWQVLFVCHDNVVWFLTCLVVYKAAI